MAKKQSINPDKFAHVLTVHDIPAPEEKQFDVNALVSERTAMYQDAWLKTGETLASLQDQGRLDEILSTPFGYALIIILNKTDRLLADPNNLDSWKDIAGYATLVAQHIERSS